MFKLDLHTHSVASHDGGISIDQYKKALHSGLLDYIAITDHNTIDVALSLHKELGDKIIIGEEIMTKEGEIIGLFLKSPVASNLPISATIDAIKSQGGVVYVPHPFETIRKGLHPETLEQISDQVDIIEICNGRAFAQNRSEQTVVWAKMNHKLGAASSDAHGFHGLGKTYTSVAEPPSQDNLLELLASATPFTERPALRSLLYPKYNKFRKKIRGQE